MLIGDYNVAFLVGVILLATDGDAVAVLRCDH
jgi:hypothetical protein